MRKHRDLYRKVRRVIRETEAGLYDQLAAAVYPRHESTVTDASGRRVNRRLGRAFAADNLEVAKFNVGKRGKA